VIKSFTLPQPGTSAWPCRGHSTLSDSITFRKGGWISRPSHPSHGITCSFLDNVGTVSFLPTIQTYRWHWPCSVPPVSCNDFSKPGHYLCLRRHDFERFGILYIVWSYMVYLYLYCGSFPRIIFILVMDIRAPYLLLQSHTYLSFIYYSRIFSSFQTAQDPHPQLGCTWAFLAVPAPVALEDAGWNASPLITEVTGAGISSVS
jgi:hypothetical protein